MLWCRCSQLTEFHIRVSAWTNWFWTKRWLSQQHHLDRNAMLLQTPLCHGYRPEKSNPWCRGRWMGTGIGTGQVLYPKRLLFTGWEFTPKKFYSCLLSSLLLLFREGKGYRWGHSIGAPGQRSRLWIYGGCGNKYDVEYFVWQGEKGGWIVCSSVSNSIIVGLLVVGKVSN